MLLFAIILADQLFPPDLSRVQQHSTIVRAASGEVLRSYLTPDGMVRLPATPQSVSQSYLRLLVAYEDQHFYRHSGVFLPSLFRAGGQWIKAGRIVSGGSTLTMQLVRLLEPRPRTLLNKAIELLRAWQLEGRYSKQQLLGFYLTLAPYGGNLEGVAAGSRALFGKMPAALSLSESATLVALTQSPTSLRKNPVALKAARNKVLALAGARAGLGAADIRAARAAPLLLRDLPQPFIAPLLADRLRGQNPGNRDLHSLIDMRLQLQLERRMTQWQAALDPHASMAILVVRLKDRSVRAYLGSSDFRDAARRGQVDAVQAIRSPGSTLKPFIYARAFDDALAHPMTLVDDVETSFGVYAPSNFEGQYHGQVTLADALRLSLNVPAVMLLDRIGPVAFTARMQRCGLPIHLPKGARPDLPIALGGAGVRLDDLAAAYAALADDGIVRPLRLVDAPAAQPQLPALAGERARRFVADILASAPLPPGVSEGAPAAHRISVKTGTSYGYRDAWAFGYDDRHVVAVWTGRPDGTPSPGRFGLNSAAPVLYEIFALLGAATPARARDTGRDDPLPPGLERIGPAAAQQQVRALRIAFPVDGTTLAWVAGRSIALEARGGTPPYVWLDGGAPIGTARDSEPVAWTPDGPGFQTLTLLDSRGAAARVRIRLAETIAFTNGF